METNKELAIVNSVKLVKQDTPCLTFYIDIDYENGFSQSIGGYALDEYSKKHSKRIGTAYGCEMIRQILDLFKVDDFSQIKNKNIWVLGTGSGLSFKPIGIQMLRNDGSESLIFDDVLEMFEE